MFGRSYPRADATVAGYARARGLRVLMEVFGLDGDSHGPAVTAAVVDLSALDLGRWFRACVGRRHVFRVFVRSVHAGTHVSSLCALPVGGRGWARRI